MLLQHFDTDMQTQTIIIFDNQDLTRLGLINLLGQHIKLADIELAFSKKELRKLLESNPMASVFVDLDSSDFNDLKDLALVMADFAKASCLFLLQDINEGFIHEANHILPTANMVLKTNTQEEIIAAITATNIGKKYFCSEALDVILGNKSRKADTASRPSFSLTSTEKEIVQLLAQGKSTKEIADERCLSYHTVITHRKNIFRKMEVNTVHELTKLALKHGLVDMTEYYI